MAELIWSKAPPEADEFEVCVENGKPDFVFRDGLVTGSDGRGIRGDEEIDKCGFVLQFGRRFGHDFRSTLRSS